MRAACVLRDACCPYVLLLRETFVALSTIFDRESPARSLWAAEASVDMVDPSLGAQEAPQLINCNTPNQWGTALGILP